MKSCTVSALSRSGWTTIWSPLTATTVPSRFAAIMAPESSATLRSSPVPDEGRLADQERHRLALHVRAHERAVGVVVLEERDEGRRRADQLDRRDVHVVHLLGRNQGELALAAGEATRLLRASRLVVVQLASLAWAMVYLSS